MTLNSCPGTSPEGAKTVVELGSRSKDTPWGLSWEREAGVRTPPFFPSPLQESQAPQIWPHPSCCPSCTISLHRRSD